jgi:hypothetical protein
MGKQIYDKPIRLLFREFADRLKEGGVFKPQVAVDWFQEYYPKIDKGSVRAHLIRLTTNNPTRVHYKAIEKDDLFFRKDSKDLRKYNPQKDPQPIYAFTTPRKQSKLRIRINAPIMETRVEDLMQNFHYYLNHFTKNIKFSGPSIYFHKKVIEKIRNSERYEQLLEDNPFFEYIYATLASWGMHKMGDKGAKMVEYNEFKESIRSNKRTLLDLAKFKLELIPEEQVDQVRQKLKEVFSSLRVTEGEATLVGNSKTLHHLLPDLVTPIDRQHILRFFYNNTNIDHKDEEIFLRLFDQFRCIAHSLKLEELTFEGFNTSIPKIIDNAIIGYAMMKLLKKRNRHES